MLDSELSFDQHTSSICSKARKKLHALGRIATLVSFNKHRTLMKAFIQSQFNYCPLIWMLHSKTMNNKMNRIHERALRLVYSDHVSLNFTNFFTVFLEVSWKISSISTQVFHTILGRNDLYSRNPKIVKYGTETISYLAPKMWSQVPNAIKSSKSLDVFKSKIRQWEPDCPCRLCKNYLQHVGFI